jgi:hypothetical protein
MPAVSSTSSTRPARSGVRGSSRAVRSKRNADAPAAEPEVMGSAVAEPAPKKAGTRGRAGAAGAAPEGGEGGRGAGAKAARKDHGHGDPSHSGRRGAPSSPAPRRGREWQ